MPRCLTVPPDNLSNIVQSVVITQPGLVDD